jgi:hypothetical protein
MWNSTNSPIRQRRIDNKSCLLQDLFSPQLQHPTSHTTYKMSPSKDNPSSSSTPKIAIKGFSLSSKSSPSSAKPKPQPHSSLGKRARTTFTHDDDESDSGGDERNGRKHEVVTGFGEEGAIRHVEKRKDEPLVIKRIENRDWRGEMRARRGGGGKNLLPPEVIAAREVEEREHREGKKEEGVDVVNSTDGEIKWGLSINVKRRVESEEQDQAEGEAQNDNGKEEEVVEVVQEKEVPQSADDEALAALLGQRKEKKGPELVIPSAPSDSLPLPPISEADAYKRAIATAPDVSTLEDYEAVPVDDFGAAMLRGMGWKGEIVGKRREVKRRQNLLGLGAKELKDAEELGAWVQKSDVKRLNEGGSWKGEKRVKAGEYRREEEKRRETREERGGGGYRDRERDGGRDRDRERDGGRDRDRERDRRR